MPNLDFCAKHWHIPRPNIHDLGIECVEPESQHNWALTCTENDSKQVEQGEDGKGEDSPIAENNYLARFSLAGRSTPHYVLRQAPYKLSLISCSAEEH